MPPTPPNIITGFYVWVNGESLLGRLVTATTPEINPIKEKIHLGGQASPQEFIVGFDIMKGELVLIDVAPMVLARMADFTATNSLLITAGTQQQGTPVAVVPNMHKWEMQVQFDGFKPDTLEAGKIIKYTYKYIAKRYMFAPNGIPSIYVDVDNVQASFGITDFVAAARIRAAGF